MCPQPSATYWMVFACFLPVRLLDLLLVSGFEHSKDFIVVLPSSYNY